MTAANIRRDFDSLSAVYDETREPLDTSTISGLREFLLEHRWSAVLEVGVGTGRVARPLVDLGIRVVGVDGSRGMLARAASKGLPCLVRGDACRLPFLDRSFDVCLFVHVLHVLEHPDVGLREAQRVGRGGALAVLDLPPKNGPTEGTPEEEPRRIVREILAEEGFPDLLRSGPRAKEQEILRGNPPSEIRVLSDREITEPLAKRLDLIGKRAYRQVLRVPPEVLERAVAAARKRVGARRVTYRRTEAVVWWDGSASPAVAHR